jgi:hypothetical protein
MVEGYDAADPRRASTFSRCYDSAVLEADAEILPVPLPLLTETMAAGPTSDIASYNSRETSSALALR